MKFVIDAEKGFVAEFDADNIQTNSSSNSIIGIKDGKTVAIISVSNVISVTPKVENERD